MEESLRRDAVEKGRSDLTVKRQFELLSINRSSAYRQKRRFALDPETIDIMNKIDAIHTAHPTFGYRKIKDILSGENPINHKRILRLMRIMEIISIYPKPNLSKRFHAQYVRPYLLRNLNIVRPDQVWGMDISYIKMNKGFMYLFIIIVVSA